MTAVNVVDHVIPHRGDWTKPVRAMPQSAKPQIELHGYRTDIGLDGLPTDPNHPFNRAR